MISNPPREGLPPCIIAYAECENRAVGMHKGECRWIQSARQFDVAAGHPHATHPDGHPFAIDPPYVVDIMTDDPAEAEAAYERGEHWVRTEVRLQDEKPDVLD